MQSRIERINRLNLEHVEIEALVEELRPLLLGYQISTPILGPSQRLFRGVKRLNRPVHVSEIGYPPASKISTFGRVNRPGQTRFYCSVGSPVPFFELGVQSGDFVALSQWRIKQPLLVTNAGFSPEAFARLNSTRVGAPHWQLAKPTSNTPDGETVHRFFCDEFCRIVPVGAEYQYKLAVAVAELMLGPIGNLDTKPLKIAEPRFSGIAYPSIATRGNSDNLALFPDTADRFLELINVKYIEVGDATGDMQFQINKIDFANSFPDGKIQWRGRHEQWTLPPSRHFTFTAEYGEWVARDENGEIVEPN